MNSCGLYSSPLCFCLVLVVILALPLVACASTATSTPTPDLSFDINDADVVPPEPPEVKVTLDLCDEWINYLSNSGSVDEVNFSLENQVGTFFGTPVTAGQALDFYLICGDLFLETETPADPGSGNRLDLNYAICTAYILYVTALVENYDTPQQAAGSSEYPNKAQVVEGFLGHPIAVDQAADFIDQCGDVLMAYGVFDGS